MNPLLELEQEQLTDESENIGLDILRRYNVKVSPKPFVSNGIEVGTPFCLSEAVALFGKNIIPDVLGIYHLFYNDQLVYIGMSRSIRGRLLGHLKDNDMPFTYVLWFPMKEYTVTEVLDKEYKMIKYYKPVLNETHANCR